MILQELNEREIFLLTYLAQIDSDFINSSFKVSNIKGINTFNNSITIFLDYIERKFYKQTIKAKNEIILYFKELSKGIRIDECMIDSLINKLSETEYIELSFDLKQIFINNIKKTCLLVS